MLRSVPSTILLALAAQASGQFLRSWSGGVSYSNSGGFSSWTSKFSKHSSWTQGPRGNMHHEVQVSRTESKSTDQGMQRVASRTMCADGLCSQETMHSVQAGPASSAGWPERMPAGLQAMMEHLVDSPRLMEPRPSVMMAPPGVRIGALVPPKPLVVVQLRPALRGSRPIVVSDADMRRFPEALVPPHEAPHSPAETFEYLALVYMSLVGTLLGTFLLLIKCFGKVEARAPQITTLAEPLAPTQETPAALPAAAPRQQVATEVSLVPSPTEKYLVDVYARAQEKVDLAIAKADQEAIQQYLLQMYERMA